ncbi:MAG: DUF960 family protein [Lactobacillus sp.]|jgi:hypothetical protein|nr:DUF960 family protein [Lactobacillus sp.]
MIRRPRFNNPTQRAITDAVSYETPRFFIKMIWSYVDSLWVDNIRPSEVQYFHIQQNRRQCDIAFQQDSPQYHDHWSIDLINDDFILPQTLVLVNARQVRTLCLPDEVPNLLS